MVCAVFLHTAIRLIDLNLISLLSLFTLGGVAEGGTSVVIYLRVPRHP